MRNRWTTAYDIARLAGCSPSTVSNVFNNRGRCSEATRRRVLAAAEELHYTPNALVRSLQLGRTQTIGVFTWRVLASAGRSINTQVLQGATEALGRAQYDSLLYSLHPDEGQLGGPSLFLDGRVDGLITAPGGLTRQGLDALRDARLPTVALYQKDIPEELGSVGIDNRSGIVDAVQHLANLGHQHLAFVSPVYSVDFVERREAFLSSAASLGLQPTLLTCTTAHEPHIQAFADRLLPSEGSPTAVIAGYDTVALDLYDRLVERGVDVPRDISLVGFDDSPGAAAPPGLTTIRQDACMVGALAAEMVVEMVGRGPAATRHLQLPVELVVRNTTAEPRRPISVYA